MTFRTIERSGQIRGLNGLEFITFKGNSVKVRVDVSIYIPEALATEVEAVPVIILLHGVYGSHWVWPFKGKAQITLEHLLKKGDIRTPFLLVMPSDGLWGDGSAYVPHETGNYEKLIGEELPKLIVQEFPFVNEESQFYIAGLSMGGYGAFRIGLKYKKFCGISGHSSILDLNQMSDFVEEDWTHKLNHLDHIRIEDLILDNRNDLPPIRFDCGEQDTLCLPNNELLHKVLSDKGIHHEYQTSFGEHDWEYWQKQLKATYLFFDKIQTQWLARKKHKQPRMI